MRIVGRFVITVTVISGRACCAVRGQTEVKGIGTFGIGWLVHDGRRGVSGMGVAIKRGMGFDEFFEPTWVELGHEEKRVARQLRRACTSNRVLLKTRFNKRDEH